MDYKIIASDLDGTLFNTKHRISDENLAAIEWLYNNGIYFVPASGRAFNEMPSILREHPLIRFYISSDGGTVYDKKEDRTYNLTMSRETSNRVLDEFYKYKTNMMLHADVNSYVDLDLHSEEEYKSCNLSKTWIDFVFANDVPKADFRKFAYSHEAVQVFCTFFADMNDLKACKKTLDGMDDIIVAQSDEFNLEIVSDKAGKGNALMLLADILGIDRQKTIAVGDSTNDMTMVKMAGLGLAMENAVDKLKANADEVICNNDSHAIDYIVNRYIK